MWANELICAEYYIISILWKQRSKRNCHQPRMTYDCPFSFIKIRVPKLKVKYADFKKLLEEKGFFFLFTNSRKKCWVLFKMAQKMSFLICLYPFSIKSSSPRLVVTDTIDVITPTISAHYINISAALSAPVLLRPSDCTHRSNMFYSLLIIELLFWLLTKTFSEWDIKKMIHNNKKFFWK